MGTTRFFSIRWPELVSQAGVVKGSQRSLDYVKASNFRGLDTIAPPPEDLWWIAEVPGQPDVLNSVDVARLVSDRVRDVVEPFASDVIQWVPVRLLEPGQERRYWFVHYRKRLEAFHHDAVMGRSGIPLPGGTAFDAEGLAGVDVFMPPLNSVTTFFVSQRVLDALLDAKITGMEYQSVRVL